MPRPDPLPLPAPAAELLTRQVSAGPAVLRRLQAHGRTAALPGAALARGRARVTALRAAQTDARRAAAPAGRDARLAAWAACRAQLAGQVAPVLVAHRRRTPEQVLADLLATARRHPPTGGPRATIVVRSPLPRATPVTLLGRGSAVRALTALGLRVRPLRRTADGMYSHLVVLPVSDAVLRDEAVNVAWALPRLRPRTVATARPDRRALRLYAGTSTAAHAPRAVARHVAMVHADRAHALAPGHPDGAARGAGAVIAHPDTGWAPHSQYRQDRIDTARSTATATRRTGGNAARHTVRKEPFRSFTLTHGTATACLMVGGDGSGPTDTGLPAAARATGGAKPRVPHGRIVGIAPDATVVPIKFLGDDAVDVDERGLAGFGVVRLGDGDFVAAVEHAISIGADVLSLSVGGVVSDEVAEVLADAVDSANMIVVAAAGQTMTDGALGPDRLLGVIDLDDTVIEPARFPDVIAVAACSTDGRPWTESHRGPNVDITAPGDAIWVADFDDGVADGAEMPPLLVASSGTSFATAIVAGAAAAWVAHWGGRAVLAEAYPDTPLAHVFREVLQRSAGPVASESWDTRLFGPGVLDVERLLTIPLPPAAEVPTPPATRRNLLANVEAPFTAIGRAIDAIDDAGQAAAAAVLVLAGAFAAMADQVASDLARAYAAAEAAGGAFADDVLAAGEQLLAETGAAAEDFAEAAAAVGEQAADAFVDGIEKSADAAGEALVDAVAWLGF